MNKLIIIGFFCLFSILAQAEVQLQTDSSQVSIDESIRLSLTQNNPQNSNINPDLTPLSKDFSILGTEHSVNYSIINGQTQFSSTWIVMVKARRTGTLTIPPIKVGHEQTTPLTITVTTDSSSNTSQINQANQQQDIILTTSVDNKNPFVNQQVTLKVVLYNAKQLLNADYQEPRVENALLIPLGREKRYQTQKNNQQYLAEEQNYAIFPQKSGPLQIKSPIFNAVIYNFQPQRIKAQGKTISLDVQPIPKEYTGNKWLPAKQITLTEDYEHIGQTLSQGSTLVRTITLKGVGVPAQLVPMLNFSDTDDFNVYPEKSKEKNQIVQGELVSDTQIKITYLFNKSGTITIPEIRLPWFNTQTGTQETASLAPKNIEITPTTSSPKQTNTNPSSPTKTQDASSPSATLQPSAPSINNWSWIIAGLFALAWLLTLILWKRQKPDRNIGKNSYKKALDELHTACMLGNPHDARDALLKWAKLYWPDAPILNLTDLTHLITDTLVKKQIYILSQALYQGSEYIVWRGDELWRSLQNLKQTNYKTKNKPDVLPPINPS